MIKFVAIFLMLSYKLVATELDVTLLVTNKNYTIGDKILLQYKVECGNDLRLIPPDFSNVSPQLECLNSNFDSTTKILSATFISFETGSFNLPPIPFVFENISNKRLFTHLSPAQKIQVDDIKISSNQIKEMEFEELAERKWNLWGIFGVVFLLAILIYGVAIKLKV